ncbi:hypothetical protein JX265_004069 [Neoarthrinium moseri]|uniref:ASX DEUBAD domain-containing protein n=1 Tax=Neoarthrinium moseri TaxID=1658444 RepID=A0A9P9WRI4_9PEZI|nr:hypothetical protein JX266_001583 [Neoarthrinium moseri]KAI1876543.1 hypothetical protein JX265_004069 [Neoarthrinium moseri]
MELLVDEKSPLADTNLRALILDPEIWKLLSPEQVAEVHKYWPYDGPVPDLAALASNDNLRHDVAEYQAALRSGMHDAEWIRQARAANAIRNEEAQKQQQSQQQSASATAATVSTTTEEEGEGKGDEDHVMEEAVEDSTAAPASTTMTTTTEDDEKRQRVA